MNAEPGGERGTRACVGCRASKARDGFRYCVPCAEQRYEMAVLSGSSEADHLPLEDQP